MKLFQIFYKSERFFIEAESELSARYRALALLKLMGIQAHPYQMVIMERSEGLDMSWATG